MEPSMTSSADRFAQIPPKTADLKETWAFLNPGLDHFMSNLEADLTFANCTNLYTVTYNYCTSTKMVLALLVKAKILVNEEKDQYDLNPGFKSKKIQVNLNQPIKAEVKAESSDVLKAVDEDRKYVIQATIVRIMKARKTMKDQALIQEVISQISQRFAPKIPDIKKAVETLLEQEYLERVYGLKDTVAYVE
ncbi:winged helix DNA-binding domain-containing protein [Guyanagaster necrorhizus]|uniref:Winged helix DNA-binding domain-containing protein n=1 Tax=Guyanagaster necrorhizus TaxID=856835 RepID=A0A9P7VWH8_9AGAR|nr:winged helix DNA-binding domain-containing protein [Guyanagaster necrorhizus MCA 3950]KAG7447720.1 winged helix DNA-binding domain-containing protein [Guyanagaster necrorhizus MCA 3950]